MNTIERIRIRLGLTVPQMLEALESKPGRYTLFTAEDDDIDGPFLSRARMLEEAYEEWAKDSLKRITDLERREPGRKLTALDMSRFFGISEFHLAQLRVRGQVKAKLDPPNRYVYSYAGARELLTLNSTHLLAGSRRTRGPLAKAFLTWLATHDEKESTKIPA